MEERDSGKKLITLVAQKGAQKEEKENITWIERIDLFDKKADYHFFRATPFCKDGYKDKMEKELEKREWSCGMGELTYKENIPFPEVVSSVLFARAYIETYNSVINGDPLNDVPLTVSEFLGKVDSAKREKEEEYRKKYPEEPTLDKLIKFLRNEGFESE